MDAVNTTALMVAAARAIETNRPDGLFRDPYAEAFVTANSELPTRIEQVPDGEGDRLWGRGGSYFALRTRTFDDFLLGAARHASQIVLLGAGFDSRSLRLDWPAGTVCYELDQPQVLALKDKVLVGVGVEPTPTRRVVPTDVTGDWANALREAGFDPSRPTCWLAEGLLPYLGSADEERLVGEIDALSAPGSRFGLEFLMDQDSDQIRDDSLYDTTEAAIGTRLSDLFRAEQRPDSVAALRRAGWEVGSHPVVDFTLLYGRGPATDVVDALTHARWALARKSG